MGPDGGVPDGTRAVAVFLVNERTPVSDDEVSEKDRVFVFQAGLALGCEAGFVPRPNPRGGADAEPDERVADLQYHDAVEYAVGHNVSVGAVVDGARCCRAVTTWTPRAVVEVVEPAEMAGVELGMEALADAPAGALAGSLRRSSRGTRRGSRSGAVRFPRNRGGAR